MRRVRSIDTAEVRDEGDAARIVLVAWVVEADLARGHAPRLHWGSHPSVSKWERTSSRSRRRRRRPAHLESRPRQHWPKRSPIIRDGIVEVEARSIVIPWARMTAMTSPPKNGGTRHDHTATSADGTEIAWSRSGGRADVGGGPSPTVRHRAGARHHRVGRVVRPDRRPASVTTRVITLDLRGHGESGHCRAYDLASMAGDVVAVIAGVGLTDGIGAPGVHLVGPLAGRGRRVSGRCGAPGGQRRRHRPVPAAGRVQGTTSVGGITPARP